MTANVIAAVFLFSTALLNGLFYLATRSYHQSLKDYERALREPIPVSRALADQQWWLRRKP